METIISPARADLTIRRPDGTIETVTHKSIAYITPQALAQLQASTKAAGRGEVLAVVNVAAQYATDASETDWDIAVEPLVRKHDKSQNAGNNPALIATTRLAADKAIAAWQTRWPNAQQPNSDPGSTAYYALNNAINANSVQQALGCED